VEEPALSLKMQTWVLRLTIEPRLLESTFCPALAGKVRPLSCLSDSLAQPYSPTVPLVCSAPAPLALLFCSSNTKFTLAIGFLHLSFLDLEPSSP
jgi:hypothetical protein